MSDHGHCCIFKQKGFKMAAKATKVADGVASAMGPRNRSIYFDLKESDLKGLSLGDEVTLIVKAEVKSVSAPHEWIEDGKQKKDPYGDVRFKVLDYEFRKESEFSKLMDDDED